MKQLLFTGIILFLSIGVKAHQPDLSSTLLVEQSESNWVLQIRTALTALQYEIQNRFGEESYSTPEEFQELVLQHVEENVSIQFNKGEAIALQNGKVNLGHESSITYEILAIPSELHSLQVMNSSFSNIARNQSALIVIKEGFEKDQFTLNNSNEHTAALRVVNSKFELIAPGLEKNGKALFLIVGVALLVLSILFWLYKRTQSMKKKEALELRMN